MYYSWNINCIINKRTILSYISIFLSPTIHNKILNTPWNRTLKTKSSNQRTVHRQRPHCYQFRKIIVKGNKLVIIINFEEKKLTYSYDIYRSSLRLYHLTQSVSHFHITALRREQALLLGVSGCSLLQQTQDIYRNLFQNTGTLCQ